MERLWDVSAIASFKWGEAHNTPSLFIIDEPGFWRACQPNVHILYGNVPELRWHGTVIMSWSTLKRSGDDGQLRWRSGQRIWPPQPLTHGNDWRRLLGCYSLLLRERCSLGAWQRIHFSYILYNRIVRYLFLFKKPDQFGGSIWGFQNGLTWKEEKRTRILYKENALPVFHSYELLSASWSSVKLCTTRTAGQYNKWSKYALWTNHLLKGAVLRIPQGTEVQQLTK